MQQEMGYDVSALAATFRSELAAAHAEFQQVLEHLTNEDLALPTSNPAWSVGEQLMHIVYWLQYTPEAVQLVRKRASLRSRLSRAVPAALFDQLNIWLTHQAARGQTRQTILQRYNLAHQAALNTLESIRPEEWTQGALFAAFHGEYRTITTIFRSNIVHQAEHLDVIRRALALKPNARVPDSETPPNNVSA